MANDSSGLDTTPSAIPVVVRTLWELLHSILSTTKLLHAPISTESQERRPDFAFLLRKGTNPMTLFVVKRKIECYLETLLPGIRIDLVLYADPDAELYRVDSLVYLPSEDSPVKTSVSVGREDFETKRYLELVGQAHRLVTGYH